MKILKVLSRLLDYPTHELLAAEREMKAIIADSELRSENKQSLLNFVDTICQQDLFDTQERYDLLFDRGRSLSLLLFEHVHGESRDRGQAMVDLMATYQSKGFEICSAQLPDYLPLFIEFLSEQDHEYIAEWLGDVVHLLTLLSERLAQRNSDYRIIFDCLIELSGVEVDRQEAAKQVAAEKRDDTPEAIDKEWEDKEIRFDDPVADSCPQAASQRHTSQFENTVPIQWLDENISPRQTV